MGEIFDYDMFEAPPEEPMLSPEEEQYQRAREALRAIFTPPPKEDQSETNDDLPWSMSAYDYLLTDYPRYASHDPRGSAFLKTAVDSMLESLKQKLSPVVSAARLTGRSLAGVGKVVAKPLKADPIFALLAPGMIGEKMDDFAQQGLTPTTMNWRNG